MNIAYYGDDYGHQTGPIIGPKTFEDIFKPRWKRHVDLAHHYSMKVMLHSCGSVSMLIPQFIEAGIDILDVVQPNITGMDLCELKEKYHEKLSFHGALCIQKVLPYKSEREVKEEVDEVVKIMSKGGGFILAPTNKVPDETPISNLLSAFTIDLKSI